MTEAEMNANNKSNRMHSVILALAVLFLLSYNFYPAAYDNDASRLDLAFSLALKGQLSIDHYHANTIDKAFYDGHYYCDKAPGVSLAAAPVVFLLSKIAPETNWHPDNPSARFPVIFIVIILPAALLMFAFIRVSGTASSGNVSFPSLVVATGTLFMPYATLFYGHAFCAILLFTAFAIWFLENSSTIQRTVTSIFFTGFLASFAALTEYPAALGTAIIVLLSIFSSKKMSHRIAVIIGAAIPAIALALYNNAAFGHPLHIGYFYEVNEWFDTEMARGLGGVTFPSIRAMFNLLFEPHRGLFWGQPFMLLAAPGIYCLWKDGGIRKTAGIIAGVLFLLCLLVNASYYEPYGGFSAGPRFLVWGLPFLGFLSAVGWTRTDSITKGIAAGAGIFSILYYALLRSVEPHVPHIFDAPVVDFTLPLLSAGFTTSNIGNILGAPPVSSIAIIAGTGVLLSFLFIFLDSKKHSVLKITSGAITGFLAVSVAFMASSLFLRPPIDQASYYLGAALIRNGQYSAAAEYLEGAVSNNPQFQKAWYSLGIACIKNEEYNEAIVGFGHAVMLDPDSIQAHISLSAAFLAAGEFDVAQAQLTESLKRFPGQPVLVDLLNKANHLLKENKEPQ